MKYYTEMLSKLGIWQTRRLDFGPKSRGSIFEDKYNPRDFGPKAGMPGKLNPNFESISVYVLLPFILLFCSCASQKTADKSDAIVSMQIIDRNGFTETISNKDRLSSFQTTDFLTSQPFQKVLRVYGRNSKGQSTSKITSYHDNGGLSQYLEAVDGRANGLYKEWFPNGQLKVESHIVEGVADIHELAQSTWVFDEECTVWDDQGNKTALFHYEKGLLVDKAFHFFPNGNIQRMIPYEKGEIHGLSLAFDEQGNILEEIPYIKGQKEGISTVRWTPTTLLSTEYFNDGKLIEATYWNSQSEEVARVKNGSGKLAQFEEGHLTTLFSIQEGIVEGEITHFHKDGTLHFSYVLKDGVKNGEEWEYHPYKQGEKPIPKLCIHWEQDQIQGQIKTWYPTGQAESQREIHNNKKQGSCFAWYKNGDLMLTEEYENDLLVKGAYYKKGDKKAVTKIDSGKGIASLYTPEGIFLKKINYEKGKPLLYNDSVR